MKFKKWFPLKHDFDLDNPLIDHVKITEEHSLSGETKVKNITLTGFVCKKCDKVLWLDIEDMDNLPKSMSHGCVR